MVTSITGMARRQAILAHIARYRFSLRPVIEKLFFKGNSCDNVLRAMMKDDLIIARPDTEEPAVSLLDSEEPTVPRPDTEEPRRGTLIPGGYKYYQLTLKAANLLSLPSSRTNLLGPGSIDRHLAILWFCCMGRNRLNLLETHHLVKLFGEEDGAMSSILDGSYCIELEGNHRIFKVFTPGAKDQYHINLFKKHMEDATSHPVLSRWLETRRLAYAFLMPNDFRSQKLKRDLKDDGYFQTTDIHVVTVPTHQTLDAQLKPTPQPVRKVVTVPTHQTLDAQRKSKPQPARKKACSKKSNAKY